MTRTQADSWSLGRSLVFLAATFAIVFGTLMPFGAMAAAEPGSPLVLCSPEGPRIVQVGAALDGPGGDTHPAKCPACVMPLTAALPTPPAPLPVAPCLFATAELHAPAAAAPRPPARAPPRPPSTAPPQD